jgi:hypothetical protein
MAGIFQQMYLPEGLFFDMQKSVIETAEGWSEHGIVLSELVHGATKKRFDSDKNQFCKDIRLGPTQVGYVNAETVQCPGMGEGDHQ